MVELIMVIAILAILTAVIVVSSGSNKLDGAANKLMFDLRYAQQLAISRQVFCGVSFNPSDNSYFVYIGNPSVKAIDPHTREEFFVDYDIDRAYRGTNLTNTNFGDLISFDYLGAPYGSAGIALINQGIVSLQYDSDIRAVTIQPNTGAVKVP